MVKIPVLSYPQSDMISDSLPSAAIATHCKEGFVILAIVFLTRIATVDMVLWDDTRKSLVTASYGQYSAHGVATGTTECY